MQATSPIKRWKCVGTDIYEGTRIVRVKFNEQISSFPYWVCLFYSLQSRCVDCVPSLGTFCRTALTSNSTSVGKGVEAFAKADEERVMESSRMDLAFVITCFINSVQNIHYQFNVLSDHGILWFSVGEAAGCRSGGIWCLCFSLLRSENY